MKQKHIDNVNHLQTLFLNLNREYIKSGLNLKCLQNTVTESLLSRRKYRFPIVYVSILVVSICLLYESNIIQVVLNYLLGVRCLIPNNYFIWEATRPISNCNFCSNVSEPIVLNNLSREEFLPYAYSSKPILIKRAFLDWPAMKKFDFYFFRNLYESIEDSVKSVDEECQFLHFKSNFISIRDVFSMSDARINNEPGHKSWYVGWGNCHPQILAEMRKYYPKPHFLPEDCEIPSKEYVFMGYDDGATMHLDFINRLMWQAQLRGTKTWYLKPPPECEAKCTDLSFLVEAGDAVLLDTRVWYHGTTIAANEFSLSIQSEYG